MKHLHRLIVTSATYRMSSSVAGCEQQVSKDPDNLSWWRRTPIRFESQLVRDSILAHAGTLDFVLGGSPVLAEQQDESTGRSIYFFHSENERNRFLTAFDEAKTTECYRREQSVLPQQALALTNSRLVLLALRKIAKRLSQDSKTDSVFIRKAFIVLLGITANDLEIEASKDALHAWQELPNGSIGDSRAHFVWALINHNDFVTLR